MNPKGTEIQIKPAKGRPMLTWVGKRPLRNVIAYPAQLVETYGNKFADEKEPSGQWQDWPDTFPKGGLLFHGDNKEVLAHLLANGFRGKVKLIYIDPPFDSGADYVRKISLRGTVTSARLVGEDYSLGEQVQYSDIWANDNYLQFMYERLLMLKELLSEEGSIYLHCDWHRGAYLRLLMDEVFGEEKLQNEISWQRVYSHNDSNRYGRVHDTILFYSKGEKFCWNSQYLAYSEQYLKMYSMDDGDGRKYKVENTLGPGGRGVTYDWNGHTRAWRYSKETMQGLHDQGLLYYTSSGFPKKKVYLEEVKGKPLQDMWNDINVIAGQANELTAYPTQKPEKLLERIIETSSNPGDIVLDCFLGSGTTVAMAQKTGRRWIGCDINKGAIQTTSNRLREIILDQERKASIHRSPQLLVLETEEGIPDSPKPNQLSLNIYRVNDYDLQIQHNEAVNLACEHIGITRTKTDSFFDGVLGKRLAKIIPFNHPLSPLDLEEIQKELANRPEEGRDIVAVCLGKELAVDAWLDNWNRLRKQGDFPNKIDVIELRSDPRYGGFFSHQPAQAQVKVSKTGKGIEVVIESFISPTIVERLKQQAGLLVPQVDDWRAMVESVMIDSDYDGQVFNVVLADIPEKKSDFVSGKYTLEATDKETIIAVKITDMLGEEVLVTNKNIG